MSDEEIAESLTGATITTATLLDVSGHSYFGECERLVLTLSDGRTVTVRAWGYDAWGVVLESEGP